MTRITIEEAANLTGASPQFIRIGLQRGILPWGYAVQMHGRRYTYYISKEKVEAAEGVGKWKSSK